MTISHSWKDHHHRQSKLKGSETAIHSLKDAVFTPESEGKRENPVMQVINPGFLTSPNSKVHLQNHRGML